jgi:hypothetical protein
MRGCSSDATAWSHGIQLEFSTCVIMFSAVVWAHPVSCPCIEYTKTANF